MPPFAKSVPELVTVSLSTNVEPPLISTVEPELTVPPSSASVLPPTVSIMALLPEVCSLPPEIVALSRSTCAPVPDARTKPVVVFVIALSITTLALVPSASMVFELLTLLSMSSPAA